MINYLKEKKYSQLFFALEKTETLEMPLIQELENSLIDLIPIETKDNSIILEACYFILDKIYRKSRGIKNYERILLFDKSKEAFGIAADCFQEEEDDEYILSVLRSFASKKIYTFTAKHNDYYMPFPGYGSELTELSGNNFVRIVYDLNYVNAIKPIEKQFDIKLLCKELNENCTDYCKKINKFHLFEKYLLKNNYLV